MTKKISIKFDSSGKVTNRYFGDIDNGSWTKTNSSDWPEPEPSDDETYSFYYDESTGKITVEYSEIEIPDDELEE